LDFGGSEKEIKDISNMNTQLICLVNTMLVNPKYNIIEIRFHIYLSGKLKQIL